MSVGRKTLIKEADEQIKHHFDANPKLFEQTCKQLKFKLADVMPIHESQLQKLKLPNEFSEKLFQEYENKRYLRLIKVLNILSSNDHTEQSSNLKSSSVAQDIMKVIYDKATKRKSKEKKVSENIQKIREERLSWKDLKEFEFQMKTKKSTEIKERQRKDRENMMSKRKEHFEKVLAKGKKIQEQSQKKLSQKLTHALVKHEPKISQTKLKSKHIHKSYENEEEVIKSLDLYNKKIENQAQLYDEKLQSKIINAKKHSALVQERYQKNLQFKDIEQEEILRKTIDKALITQQRIKLKHIRHRESAQRTREFNSKFSRDSHINSSNDNHSRNQSSCIHLAKSREIKFRKMLNHCKNYSLTIHKQKHVRDRVIEKHNKISNVLNDLRSLKQDLCYNLGSH